MTEPLYFSPKNKKVLLRFAIVLGLTLLSVYFVYKDLNQPILGIDDAYIFFVYAENFLAGEGFVYNTGSEPVEGFSSMLWEIVVIIAFGSSIYPELFLLFINIVLSSFAITTLWIFVDNGVQFTISGLLLVGWVFSSPSYIIWTTLTLMDTAIWSVILVIGTILVLSSHHKKYLLQFLIIITLLCRPEGMLWALIFIALAGLITNTISGRKVAFAEARSLFATYCVALFVLIAFRLLYFGYPLPNTYYAKVSSDKIYNIKEGLKYIISYIYLYKVVLIGFLPSVAGFILNMGRVFSTLKKEVSSDHELTQIRYFSLCVISLIGFLVPILNGGDHFALFRFYQSIWPLIFLPAIWMIKVIDVKIPKRFFYSIFIPAISLFVIFQQPNPISSPLYRNIIIEFIATKDGKQTGDSLSRLFPDKPPSVGVITAGAFAFKYEGYVFDVMGLNDAEIAHAPGKRYGVKNHAGFSKEIFLKYQPDIFLPLVGKRDDLLRVWDLGFDYRNTVLKGLLNDDGFLKLYKPCIIAKDDITFTAYIHVDYLRYLAEKNFIIEIING